MEEYISRNAVLKHKTLIPGFVGEYVAVPAILSIPAVKVSFIEGRWDFKNNGRYGQTRCYCSACGKHSGIGGTRANQMKPFCPNCGARMDVRNEVID